MNKVNFLKQEYRLEPQQHSEVCGIVDGEGEQPAYTTLDVGLKWNATVRNPDSHNFQFVPIDHNIVYYKTDGKKESSCDGMLLVDPLRMIAFVELKDVRSGGLSAACDQLLVTLKRFLENHPYNFFRIRRAYAANIAHPQFHYNMKDQMGKFSRLHFVLYPEATITLK